MTYQNRIEYGNFLRAFSIVFVVLIHSSGDLLYNFPTQSNSYDFSSWLTAVFFNSISRFSVPIFIMLSGATLLSPHKSETLQDFFKKRFLKIIPPFLFWSFIYALYSSGELIAHGKPIDLKPLFNKFLFGETFHHLWFVPMILGLYFITPILRTFLKSASKQDIEYFLLLWFFSTSISSYFPTFILVKYLGWLGYAGFYLAGFYFSHFAFSKPKVLYFLGFCACLVTFLGTWTFSLNFNKLYEGFFLYLSPNCIFMSFAIFVFVKNLSSNKYFIKIQNNKIVNTLSDNSFGIYLIHLLVIEYLKHGYLGFQVYNNNFIGFQIPTFLAVPLLLFSSLFLSLFFVLFLKKIPLLKLFV